MDIFKRVNGVAGQSLSINPYHSSDFDKQSRWLQKFLLFYEGKALPRLPVLLYHRVHPSADRDNPFRLKKSPEVFEEHLKVLVKNKKIHFADDLIKNRSEYKSGRDIAITFDDGYRDNYKYAFPLIKKYQVPVTIFITTGFIDSKLRMLCDELNQLSKSSSWPENENLFEAAQRLKFLKREEIESILVSRFGKIKGESSAALMEDDAPMSWSEVMEMKESGLVRFEPHGQFHQNLSRLTKEEAKREIETSIVTIKEKLGVTPSLYAYAFGSPADINEVTPDLIQSLGLSGAFLANEKVNTRWSDPFRLDRVSV